MTAAAGAALSHLPLAAPIERQFFKRIRRRVCPPGSAFEVIDKENRSNLACMDP
jgi:hypothetical protein